MVIKKRLLRYWKQPSAFAAKARRLLAAAALLHVGLAVALFWAGRAQVAPGLIDRDGIVASYAFDSYVYQSRAARLVAVLKQQGFRAWATESAPPHIKLISVEFALLGPLFGYGTLSAEPLNLLCYLAILALVLALGREVGGPKVGLISACVVALWPTLLLHTLQILKDPLFIAGALTLLLCVVTWLTRTYDRRSAVAVGALITVTALLLIFVRHNLGPAIIALVLIGLVLLIIRQLREGRLLFWNMAGPFLLLLAAGASLLFSMTSPKQRLKHYPADQSGQPKAAIMTETLVPTVVSYRPHVHYPGNGPLPFANTLLAAADDAAQRVSSFRSRFAASYPVVGSGVDNTIEFGDFKELVLYLPRAFEIGFWSPFPETWAASGRRVGNAGKLLSGAETLVIYVCQLLALAAVWRGPRRLASWLLLLVTTCGMTALGLMVPNVGALYRFRYTFWILLIILGAKGCEKVWLSFRRRQHSRKSGPGQRAAVTLLIFLLISAGACSSRSSSSGVESGAAARAQDAAPEANGAPAEHAANRLGFVLLNSTGTSFRALYLSPSDSAGWEENILGTEELPDGEAVDLRFSPAERATLWDLKVEGLDGYYAEWKRLELRGASKIRLSLKFTGEAVVVAEVEK